MDARWRGILRQTLRDPEKACPARDAGWTPVSRLREAVEPFSGWIEASAGEGRSDKIMPQ